MRNLRSGLAKHRSGRSFYRRGFGWREDFQADRHGVGADDATAPRVRTGAEVFDIHRIAESQAGQKLAPALGDSAFEKRRFVGSLADGPGGLDGAGALHDIPTAERDEEFFGEVHCKESRVVIGFGVGLETQNPRP